MPDVSLYFKPHFLRCCRDQVQRHFVHFYRSLILLLLKVDVSHVYPQAASVRELFRFDHFLVSGQSILMKPVGVEGAGQRQLHTVAQFHVYRLSHILLFPQLAELLLFVECFLRLFEALGKVGSDFRHGTLLDKEIDLLLLLLELFLRVCVELWLVQIDLILSHVRRVLLLEVCSSVRGHRPCFSLLLDGCADRLTSAGRLRAPKWRLLGLWDLK